MAVAVYSTDEAPLAIGAYSIAEAARFTDAHPNTVRSWFRIVPQRAMRSVFRSDYTHSDSEELLSFLDLVDTKIAVELRRRGVRMQKIRKVNDALQDYWQVIHPFCYRKFYVSKGEVYAEIQDDRGTMLIEVLTRQGFDKTVMEPFLHRLEFNEETNLAERWHITPGIVLDPRIGFGEPMIRGTRIPARTVAKMFFAENCDARYTGETFGLKAQEVLQAVDFYQQFDRPGKHEAAGR